MSKYVRERPGLRWVALSVLLGIAGFVVAFRLDSILGIPLLVLAALGLIGWRSDSDFRRGWPPWPFADDD